MVAKKEAQKKVPTNTDAAKKRRQIRFTPENNITATIDLNANTKIHAPSLLALVFSESFGGCGVLMLLSRHLQIADTCKVQIGELAPARAEVVWRVQLDDQSMKIGFRLME